MNFKDLARRLDAHGWGDPQPLPAGDGVDPEADFVAAIRALGDEPVGGTVPAAAPTSSAPMPPAPLELFVARTPAGIPVDTHPELTEGDLIRMALRISAEGGKW